MKILKIVLISFLVLVAALAVAAVIFIKTLDVNKYKPMIVEQAGKALGRQVDFRDAGVGIGWNGIGLRLNGLTVSEDPAFGKGEFLSVRQVSVGVDVLGYLFGGKISITGILIDSLRVTVIRGKDGAINAQTIGKQTEGAQQAPSARVPPAAPAALPAIFVSSIKGQNGTVTYIDRSFDPPLTVAVEQLAFTVNRLSLSDAFPFSVQAAVFSDRQNVQVDGKCQLDLKNNAARVFDLRADSDLSRLALKKITQAVPMVPAQALPTELKGNLTVSVPELKAGSAGLGALNCKVSLAQGKAKLPQMGAPVTDIAADLSVTQKDIMFNSLSARIGDGTLKGSGWLKDYQAAQDFDFAFGAEKLGMSDLIAQEQMPVKMEGLIAAKGQVKGHGFTPEALRTNLVGEATVDVKGGVLKGVNVLSAVLDKLNVIPGLGEVIKAGLPETAFQQRLQQKDTPFNDFSVPLAIVNGHVVIKDTSVSSEGLFTFNGKGDAGFDGSFSLEGEFLLAPELSRALADRVKPMRYLLNDKQMVYIPLKVSGAAGAKLQFSPDAQYIARKMIENQGQQLLRGLLGGQQQEGQPQAGQQQGAQPQGQQQPSQGSGSSNTTSVDDLLKSLFKK